MLAGFLLNGGADCARKTLGLEPFAQRLGGGSFVVGGEAAGDAAGDGGADGLGVQEGEDRLHRTKIMLFQK